MRIEPKLRPETIERAVSAFTSLYHIMPTTSRAKLAEILADVVRCASGVVSTHHTFDLAEVDGALEQEMADAARAFHQAQELLRLVTPELGLGETREQHEALTLMLALENTLVDDSYTGGEEVVAVAEPLAVLARAIAGIASALAWRQWVPSPTLTTVGGCMILPTLDAPSADPLLRAAVALTRAEYHLRRLAGQDQAYALGREGPWGA